jgi:hypothetical protein
VGRLSHESVRAFVEEHNSHFLDNDRYVYLPLNAGFGRDFSLLGRAFIPRTDKELASRCLYTDRATGKTRVDDFQEALPILPTWDSGKSASQTLDMWLEGCFADSQNIHEWLNSCYPYEGFPWIKSILKAIWIYSAACYSVSNPDPTLRQTWKMALAVTALTNRICVAETARKAICDKLRGYGYDYSGSGASARLVNKCVKYLFLQIYENLSKSVMSGLESLLRASSRVETEQHQLWGQIFCINNLLIVSISRMQEALNDNYMISKEDNSDIKETTIRCMQKMEDVFTRLAEIFHSKFKTRNASKSSQHNLFKNSSGIQDTHLRELVDRIADIQRSHEQSECMHLWRPMGP